MQITLGSVITLTDLEHTVGSEINARLTAICFDFVTLCLFGLLSYAEDSKEGNKSLLSNAAPDVKNELVP